MLERLILSEDSKEEPVSSLVFDACWHPLPHSCLFSLFPLSDSSPTLCLLMSV